MSSKNQACLIVILIGFSLLISSCGTSGKRNPDQDRNRCGGRAGTGAAIGSAVGGSDGWWIGALTGAAVGGATGRAVGEADEKREAERRAAYSSKTTTAPRMSYGIQGRSTVKSPYSEYSVNIGGRTRGETVFDPNTEQYFIIP
jgi:uncharacterized protein YcfJ